MLYLVLAAKSFRRMFAYRAATLAGLVTNLFFGLLRAYVFVALFAATPGQPVAGYSLRQAITYAGLAQAMIGPIRMWGAYEVMDSIRSGQIAMDLCKPFDYLGFWLARDLGRAAWEIVARGLPLLLLYGWLFDLVLPETAGRWFAFGAALILAILVSFHWQLLVNLAAFWMVDATGLARIAFLGVLLFTGIGSWRIMFSVFLGGLTMAGIFNLVGPGLGNEYMQIPVLHQLMLGSFMFGLVFMATDPVTAAQTDTGKWIYGFFIGLLAILIRVVNPAYPEGMMLAILFMNVMAPLIDHYVVQANIKRRMKRAALAA